MAWSPDPATPIREVDINTNFTESSFSYTPESGTETFTITGITANEEDAGITVGTTISGAYTGALHGGTSIYYMKEDRTYATVDSFDDIVDSFEICSYTAPSEQEHANRYTVTATGSLGTVVSTTYTITSVFDWDAGKNALINAVATTRVGR